jgi:hypothetical protein
VTAPAARLGHALVAGVTAVALVWQLALIISGAAVLVPEDDPGLPLRLVRFASYFTVQANILVLATSIVLLRDPGREGRVWRVIRLDALAGIMVTGIVHWFLLRPILHLVGASYIVDKLLHVVSPLLAVTAWVIFGPRPRINLRTIAWSLIWPASYLVYIVTFGAFSGWYPYPFLDVGARGAGAVAIAALLIAALMVVVAGLLFLVDRVRPSSEVSAGAPQ